MRDKNVERERLTILRKIINGSQPNSKVVFDDSFGVAQKFILNVRRNNDLSLFPDFVSDEAIVEHFAVTAAKQTKNGSDLARNSAIFNKASHDRFDKLREQFLSSQFGSGEIENYTDTNEFNDFSFLDLLNSVNKGIEKHRKSLDKYDLNGRKVIFLLDWQGSPMFLYVKNQFARQHYCYEDKKLLEIFSKQIGRVDYFVVMNSNYCEILDTRKLQSLIRNCQDNLDIRFGRYGEVNLCLFTDIIVH